MRADKFINQINEKGEEVEEIRDAIEEILPRVVSMIEEMADEIKSKSEEEKENRDLDLLYKSIVSIIIKMEAIHIKANTPDKESCMSNWASFISTITCNIESAEKEELRFDFKGLSEQQGQP